MTFVPPAWSGLTSELQRASQLASHLTADPHGNQPWLVTRVPRDAQWLAARADFAAQWEAFVSIGQHVGFLERVTCYECDGALEVTTDDYTIERHPNPDYRPPERGETITIPRAGA